MEFFDKLSNTITAAGKDGLNKAKELKDTAKLTMDIKEREGAIQKYYRELGKAYYHDHRNDLSPEYTLVSEIRAAFEEIGEMKEAKDEIRGIRRCKSCGTTMPPEAKFCPNCGQNCETEPKKEAHEEPDEAEDEAEETAEEAECEVTEEEPEEDTGVPVEETAEDEDEDDEFED